MIKRILQTVNRNKEVKQFASVVVQRLKALCTRLVRHDAKTTFTLFSESLRSLKAAKAYEQKGCPTVNTRELSTSRKSDTVFILGSGPSINDISAEEWNEIRKHDSWGFNFWFCHPFIPTAYFVQSVIRPESDSDIIERLDDLIYTILKDKTKEYEAVNLFLRGDGINHERFHDTKLGRFVMNHEGFTRHIVPELPVSSKNRIDLDILYSQLKKQGFYDTHDEPWPVPKFGGSITELISLAAILGYKKIVLCGIDMNDGGHFYDQKEYYEKYPFLKELSERNNKANGHVHMNKSIRKFTVKDLILGLNKFVGKEFGAEIFTYSKKSRLYPEIDSTTSNS